MRRKHFEQHGLLYLAGMLFALLGWVLADPTIEAQQGTARSTSLSAVTTGTGTAVNVIGREAIAVYITGTGTTSAGVITIEEADWDPVTASTYAGTWASLTTVMASSVTGGAQTVYHVPLGAYRFIRARVSTNVTGGGNVSAVVVAR